MVDLSEKVLEALQQKDIPAVCPITGNFSEKIPENAQMLGYVPDHLRQLYVLFKDMKAAAEAERHRRCVEFFGREEYDSETIEYSICVEVESDPNFGGFGVIERIFSWSLQLHFPQIPVTRFNTPVYYLGHNWEVYAVNPGTKRWVSTPFDIIIKK